MKLRDFLRLGVIVGTLPNTIANGQSIDAVPLMADLNWIVSQVNANAAPASVAASVASLQSQVNAIGSMTTFTPSLNFNGGTTGMTYFANGQFGFITQVGSFAFLQAMMVLSAKGSSTGQMGVNGWPVAAAVRTMNVNMKGYPINCAFEDVSNPSSLSGIVPQAFIPSGASGCLFWGMTNGAGSTAYSQLDCPASPFIYLWGFFPTV